MAGNKVFSPHSSWTTFHLQKIKVPRGVAADKCPCPICMCSKYNPIGVTGEKSVTQSPSFNVTGGQMKCEVQPPVVVRDKGLCTVCLQITGRGIRHRCSRSQVQQGRERCHSSERDMVRKRKQNLSVLVGMEAKEVQEQIMCEALTQVMVRKDNNLRLKEIGLVQ